MQVKALIFDVFGTLVDWRGSVARQAEALLQPLGLPVDGLAFADEWRGLYQSSMEWVRSGSMGYVSLDVLHRRNLDEVLAQRGWTHDVPEAVKLQLNLAWHALDAWPDVGPGLARVGQHHLLAPCSNGHFSLMMNLARHNGWRWDVLLGAQWAHDYKPKPVVYLKACEALDLPPEQVMMVAAHSSDLAAAAACGLKTAFLPRPHEHGPNRGEAEPAGPVDRIVQADWSLTLP